MKNTGTTKRTTVTTTNNISGTATTTTSTQQNAAIPRVRAHPPRELRACVALVSPSQYASSLGGCWAYRYEKLRVQVLRGGDERVLGREAGTTKKLTVIEKKNRYILVDIYSFIMRSSILIRNDQGLT